MLSTFLRTSSHSSHVRRKTLCAVQFCASGKKPGLFRCFSVDFEYVDYVIMSYFTFGSVDFAIELGICGDSFRWKGKVAHGMQKWDELRMRCIQCNEG